MKKHILILLCVLQLVLFIVVKSSAQCSICAKTTQQLGEKPAKAFNAGIIYLMLTPFAIVGYVGYRWWRGK